MKKLATAIKLAAGFREDSYDNKSAEVASNSENDIDLDFKKFYKLDLKEACDKAAEAVGYDTGGTEPIYLLLNNSWNESLAWAETVLLNN